MWVAAADVVCHPQIDAFSATNNKGCALENHHADVDVVVVAVKPSCISTYAVRGLNRFMGPRRIVVIAPNEQRCVLRFSTMNKGPHVRGFGGHRTNPKGVVLKAPCAGCSRSGV